MPHSPPPDVRLVLNDEGAGGLGFRAEMPPAG